VAQTKKKQADQHIAEGQDEREGEGQDVDQDGGFSQEQINKIMEELVAAPTWSAKIRLLHMYEFRNSSIALIISQLRGYTMSPQHVNNVLQRPLKSEQGARGVGRPRQQIDERTAALVRKLPKPVIEE